MPDQRPLTGVGRVVAWKRHRSQLGFTVFLALGILELLVLDGATAGATLLVAMLVFIFTCVHALRSEDPAAVKAQRAHRPRGLDRRLVLTHAQDRST